MQGLVVVVKVFLCETGLPGHVDGVGIIQFVENSVTTEHDEVVFILVDLERGDVRVSYDNPWIAFQLG